MANVYEGGRLVLFHLDLYRLESAESLHALGYEEYVYGDGVAVIEWLDRVPKAAPLDYLRLTLQILGAKSRALAVEDRGPRARALLEAFSARLDPRRPPEP